MSTENKRRHQRVDSLNLSYVCVDENGTTISQSMGRTLNVSESGICLETHFAVKDSHCLTVTIALENVLVDIKGKVVYCRNGSDGSFETGLEFVEIDQQGQEAMKEFITIFNQQNNC